MVTGISARSSMTELNASNLLRELHAPNLGPQEIGESYRTNECVCVGTVIVYNELDALKGSGCRHRANIASSISRKAKHWPNIYNICRIESALIDTSSKR